MEAVVYGIKKLFTAVPDVTCQQLQDWKADDRGLICFDTRTVEEYEVSHLPDSVLIDPDLQHSLDSLGISTDKRVVCYCSVGYRSSKIVQQLMAQGSTNIYNLQGGIFQWALEGRELVQTNGRSTAVVHPYNAFWGLLLPNEKRSVRSHY